MPVTVLGSQTYVILITNHVRENLLRTSFSQKKKLKLREVKYLSQAARVVKWMSSIFSCLQAVLLATALCC